MISASIERAIMKRLFYMFLLIEVLAFGPGRNAFVMEEEDPFEMRAMDLGNNTLPSNGPLPSPDGNYILYHSSAQLSLREWMSNRRRIIAKADGSYVFAHMAWSPDGKYISFNKLPNRPLTTTQPVYSRYSDVCLLTVATGEIRVIPGTANAHEISWSPDSLRLGLLVLPERRYENSDSANKAAAARPGSADFPASYGEARLVSIETGEFKVMGPASPWADFTWSPDSKRVAFVVRQAAGQTNEIRVYSIETGESQVFRAPGGSILLGTSIPPLPTTPGTTNSVLRHMAGYGWTTQDAITFSIRPWNSWKFFLMPLSTGVPKEICSEPAAKYKPECHAFSPDGAFAVLADRNSQRMMLRDIKTGVESPITQGRGEEDFMLASPDGRLAVFASDRQEDWALYVAPLDRGPIPFPVRIASLGARPGEKLGAWWTPAGRLVLGLKFPVSRLYRMAMNGQGRAIEEPGILPCSEEADRFAPSVSPDGVHIAYWRIKGAQKGLAVMNANGKEERFLLEYPIQFDSAPQLNWQSASEVSFIGLLKGIPNFLVVNIDTDAVLRLPRKGFRYREWGYLPQRKELIASPSTGNPASAVPLNALDAALFPDLRPPDGSVPRSPLMLESLAAGSDNFFVRCVKGIASTFKLHSFPDGAPRVYPGLDIKTDVALDFAVSPDSRRIAYLHINNADLDSLKKNMDSLKTTRIPLEIRLIDSGSSARKTLVKFPDFAPLDPLDKELPEPQSFSPDGRFLIYSDPRGRLQVADTETGNHWTLLASPVASWKDARWLKDGSVVLAKADSRVEWKSFEGVTYSAVLRFIESRAQR